MNTTVIVEDSVDHTIITIKIPREDLFWLTDNQREMLSLTQDKPIKDQIRIILILILHMFSRGENNG